MASGDKTRVPRKDRTGPSPFKVGAIVLAVIVVGSYLGFSKHIPFTHGFRVKAVFNSAVSIRANSPVRIAGVNVGKVKKVEREPGTDASVVTMEIDKKGLPIHKDAQMKIRPRIFLEGNFFVDVSPGTPSAPTIGDGDTIPITQTSAPVQLDQVLTSLQGDTRAQLQTLVQQLGTALTHVPTTAEDADQDPSVRGKTAAQALNQSIDVAGPAFKHTAIVNRAFLGTSPHDLSRLVRGLGRVTRSLDTRETDLQSLVRDFNVTMGSFASQSTALRRSIGLLGPTLRTADSALASLNSSFPNTRAFAREILPGVRETPSTIAAGFPWVRETRGLLQPSELRGLVNDLQPTTANLSRVVDVSLDLFPQADLLSQCATKVILPTGDVKIDEGALSSGVENYKEFWYGMVGLAGEGQNFDGNGMYVRFQPGGGDQTVSTGKIGGSAGDVFYGNALAKPLGTRPAYPGKRPPYVSDVPCKDERVPDLNAAKVGAGDGVSATAARAAVARRSGAATPSAPAGATTTTRRDDSVTSELLSRLNPFRSGGR